MTTATASVPPSADLRPLMALIRDQGQRGTCLAFAVTAAHEVSRGGSPPEDLSEEALYWGCKRVDGNWKSGTRFGSAASALGRWGQPLETVWPYDATRRAGVAYSPPAAPGRDWVRSGLRQVGKGLDEIRSVLDDGRPLLLGLTVFDTFFRPDAAGHIADPPVGAQPRGRHAVLAVGHQPGELLIRNSWGASWALGGYAWIADTYIDVHAGDAWVIDATIGAGPTASGTGTAEPDQGETYGSR